MALPEAVLVDTSVLLRLWIDHDDDLQTHSDRLREAFIEDLVGIVLLDLSVYEFINIQTRKFKLGPATVSANVDALFDLGVPLVSINKSLARETALISSTTGLSGYDAAFVAAAKALAIPLVTGDQTILLKAPEQAMALATI